MDDGPTQARSVENGEGGSELEGGHVAVLGAGTMGYGIAVAFAAGGWTVRLYDVDQEQLEEAGQRVAAALETLATHGDAIGRNVDAAAARERVQEMLDLPAAVRDVDIAVEAVPEDLDAKRGLMVDLEAHAPVDAVLASNTSSLPLERIGEPLSSPGRFLGTHWFNPPHIVPVVEVVRTEHTTDVAVELTREALAGIGKSPVTVARPVPGYIGNRIQSAMAHEAWSLLEAGIATAADIDTAVKGTFGFRLPVMGVFEKGDDSGLDIHRRVLEELLPRIDRRREPADPLVDLVEVGRLGRKAGRGVYDWRELETDPASIDRTRDEHLLGILAVYRRAMEAPGPTVASGIDDGEDSDAIEERGDADGNGPDRADAGDDQ